MRVKCVKNRLAEIVELEVRERLRHSIHLDGTIDGLVIGREYPVQAVELWEDGGLWFYLHTVAVSDYPYPYPAEMFEIPDNKIPSEWSICFQAQRGSIVWKRIAFSAWANNEHFYERLVDGDAEAVSAYRQQMARI